MGDTLNRTDVVTAVARRTGVATKEVERVVDGFVDVVTLALKLGEEVAIRRLGRFSIRNYKPSLRRNPATGAMHDVPARRSVGFVPGDNLKKALNP